MAGATGVLFAAEQGGWMQGTQTILVRSSAARAGSTVVISKPVLAKGFDPQRIYEKRSAGVVTVYSYYGSDGGISAFSEGSGFVVDMQGTVLTAAHVIVSTTGSNPLATPARRVYVQFPDGDKIPAQIVGWDPYDDVGVLKVAPKRHALVPLPLGSSADVRVGQPVATIGSPFEAATSLAVGVVSGTGRKIPSLTTGFDFLGAIQTDAPINQGNSGGPLLNAAGEVIGINAQRRFSLVSGFEGVGFAVPIDSAKRSLSQILGYGKVSYAYLGLETEDLTPAIAKRYGYKPSRGAMVGAVHRGGPAAQAGLRPGRRTVIFQGERLTIGGDVITAIDGARVERADDVARLVTERMVPGEPAWFTVVRGGRELVVAVTLTARPR